MERDAKKRLIGRVEMDDAYLGGQRSGGKRGRGRPKDAEKEWASRPALLDRL